MPEIREIFTNKLICIPKRCVATIAGAIHSSLIVPHAGS